MLITLIFYSQILGLTVDKITGNSICKHPNSGGAFFIRGESKLTKGVPLTSEVIIMGHHSDPNAVEHMSSHTEPATKKLGRICWIVMKVIFKQLDMAGLSVAIQRRCTARYRAPVHWCLPCKMVVDDKCCDQNFGLIVG